ncbi:hypothetical protein N8889_00155 [Candidatus Pelagibacter ubique]|nr:hypothetical protein [Candidatus Pelagibacter ubique]
MTNTFNKKTKIVAFILSLIFIVTLIEFGSFFIISKYKKNFSISTNIEQDLLVAIDKMNHVRFFESGIHYSSVDELIYDRNLTSIKSKNSKGQLLIQGDSWAEQFLYKNSLKFRKKLEILEVDWDVIYAGTSSYSPSLMAAQVQWLDENIKDFSPKIIIQIIDQSDFGDELCRYLDVRSVDLDGSVTVLAFDGVETVNQTVYSIKDKLRYSIILNSSTFNSIKLFKLAYFRVLNRLAPVKNCGWGEISKYLSSGLNSEESNYMIDMFIDYIRSLNRVENLERVILVTHPHYLHLDNSYILEMGNFLSKNLKEIVRRSNPLFKVELLHIEPSKKDLSLDNVYIEGDPASHLTNKAHSTYYLKAIKKQIDNLK